MSAARLTFANLPELLLTDSLGRMTERKSVDWEAIEREYRAGQLSVREIARRSGVTEGAVRKHAKDGGWTRALAEKVREAVRERLVRGDSSQSGSQSPRDAEIIDKPETKPAAPAQAPEDYEGEDVTYLPGDGDPPVTEWRGVEFGAGEAKRLTDIGHIEAARSNRFFRVGRTAEGASEVKLLK
jgi:hypothetical protein